MSWLRLDDNFDGHSKILRLGDGTRGDARRWTWTCVLLYTMRHDSEEIPAGISNKIPGATKAFLTDCLEIGLADQEDGRLVVHDWILYTNRPTREKVAYCLRVAPWADAATIYQLAGGRKADVYAAVKELRGDLDPAGITEQKPGPPTLTAGSREPNGNVPTPSESGSSRARGPDPTRPEDLDSSVSEIRFAVNAREPEHPDARQTGSLTHLKTIIDASLGGATA